MQADIIDLFDGEHGMENETILLRVRSRHHAFMPVSLLRARSRHHISLQRVVVSSSFLMRTREVHESRFLADHGCYDILQSDVALSGGISGLAPIARHCNDIGVVFTPHTWGNGIMLAAGLQLTAGTTLAPYIEFPCDPPNFGIGPRDFMLKTPIRPDAAGLLHLSKAPGLGFEIDEERLRATRV